MTKPRVKRGERREVNQPLKIDALPQSVCDAIDWLRDKRKPCLSWEQISAKSALPYGEKWQTEDVGFIDWEKLDRAVREKFPEMKLSRNGLSNWYDQRIEQIRTRAFAESAAAQAFAEKFVGKTIEGGNEAVLNAMRDEVFKLSRSMDLESRMKYIDSLNALTLAMARIQRTELMKKRVDADVAKSEAERAKYAALAGDPREVYLQSAQDVLKKLMTRATVRKVLEPLQAELVQELSHAAEVFAKQVEAAAS
jgi:hypothetical protein